jgi:hypothetical protein
MPIGAAIGQLKREIAERQAALVVLETLVEKGVSSVPASASSQPVKRGRPRLGAAGSTAVDAAVIIVREAGRPMHGLSEILPELERRGHHYSHRASLASSLLKSGKFVRTAPGTFGLKGGPK